MLPHRNAARAHAEPNQPEPTAPSTSVLTTYPDFASGWPPVLPLSIDHGNSRPDGGGDHERLGADRAALHAAVEAYKLPFRRVTEVVVSREPLAEAAALAIATHEHLLVHSKPGKAKSQFARYLLAQFEGEVYEKGFTEGTLEEEVVGGIEADSFRQGIVHRHTDHTLVTAHWAFLDEFTRAQRGTWDVLLGILNEGIFRNGPDIERTRLHTALAAANFLIATERFMAVRDRFVYQASLADEDSRYVALRIDQVHGVSLPAIPAALRIPLAVPQLLSDIVLGRHPDMHVHLPYWASFVKNDVIRRAVRLTQQAAQRNETIDDRLLYVSSRTIAKASDTLKASALLHHRFEVTSADLANVRYAVCTASGDGREPSVGEKVFYRALHDSQAYYGPDDLDAIDEIMHIDDVYQSFLKGQAFEFKVLPVGIRNKLLTLLPFHTWHEVSGQTFVDALQRIRTHKPEIEELRRDVLERMVGHEATHHLPPDPGRRPPGPGSAVPVVGTARSAG